VAPPVFKTGLAGIAFAGRFDSFPPPPPALPVQLDARRWDAALLACRAMRLVSATVTGIYSGADYHPPSRWGSSLRGAMQFVCATSHLDWVPTRHRSMPRPRRQ